MRGWFAVALACAGLYGPGAFAQTSVDNIARVSNPLGVPCPDAATNPNCERSDNALVTVTPLPAISTAKTADPASGATVRPGQVLNFTVATTVTAASTTAAFQLTDTLGAGLTAAAVTAQHAQFGGSCAVSGQVLSCTLPAATPPGVYEVSYSATVAANAPAQVGNQVVVAGGGDPDPVCDPCTTQHPVLAIAVNKSVAPGAGTPVAVGDTLSYTLTATVANAALNADEVLTDTLGAGLTLAAPPAGCTAAGQVLTCTVPSGSPAGTYTFNYTATVNASATTSVGNSVAPSSGTCTTCTTTNPVSPTINVSKSVNPASGTAVSVGDTLTYTLTVGVANAATTAAEVLTDTLGAGLTVGTLPAGCTAAGQVVTCTLAAGTAVGTHTFVYTATVNASATTSVSNSVAPSSGTCTTCTTTNPVNPTISVAKSVNPGSGTAVAVGDTLTYTLTVDVANAATTAAEVLTDTLGAGLTVGTLPAGCTAAGQVVTCTLAAGTAVGTHTFVYTATVNANATTAVSNSVAPSSGTCTSCTTTNPVNPTISVAKSVNPASGTAVAVGDTLTYTLTVNVANAATTVAEVLTDTLGAGLTVGTLPAGCTASGQVVTCTLAAGTAVGTHTFVYTATVAANATTSVSNSVAPSSGTCTSCTTTNPVSPTIAVAKSATPGSGGAVAVGDTLTYTLTVTVANAATTVAEVLTDTLGAGLTVGTLPAGCTVAGQVITCTLPAGTAIGTHSFVYTATVAATATTSVGNSVTASSGTCTNCSTSHPLTPRLSVNKSVNPGSGTAVAVGDVLTYTLTVDVANAATTAVETLTDTLGAGLTLGAVPAGCTAAGQVLTCTLPAGSAIGTHSFVYTATVAASAATTVGNSVSASSGTCTTCSTSNPVSPTVVVNKSVAPGSGSAVSVGDVLTYTLTVNVANAATTAAEVLTDTLGAGLTVGTLPAGCTAAGQTITCTLAAGTAIGSHSFVYTATVAASATTSVGNSVTASSGTCQTCNTVNPVDPTLTVNKSATPAGGSAVSPGDTLTYTLTVNVANAATTVAEVLTDTLGAGLAVATVPAGCSAAGQVITCTLPAGSAVGTYTFVYTATVGTNATTSVSNTVAPSSATCINCSTTHPVDPTVTVAKSVNPGSGTAVAVGDTLTYTLTVTVANAATSAAEVLIDTLGAGLTAGTVPAGCSAAGQVITCTLPAGTAIGTHTFVYTATVNTAATTSVSNSVAPSSGTCTTCTTTNPVNPTINVSKSVNPASGTAVSVGDTLTYTLTVDVANAATTVAEVLTDTLGAGLTAGTLPAGCTAAGQVITCTLAAGAAIGPHTFVYTATVAATATTAVGNSVTASSGTCTACTTTNPVDPTLTVSKSATPAGATPVAVGDTLTYTLTVNVANAATTVAEVLTDTLGAGLTVGTLPAGCTAAGQVITCTLPAGAAIGTHTFVYTATVAATATTTVSNTVAPSSGTCTSCTTTHPVASTLTVSKSVNPGSGTAVSPGDTLTYTLTVNVANAATTVAEVLTDTLGAGLTVGTLPAGCTAAGQTITCTLPIGTAIGTHTFVYTATVATSATTAVSNSVTASSGTCTACTTTNPVNPTITVAKSASPGSGTAVAVGDTLTYTLTVNVANAATTADEVLTDTLGAGLTVGTLPAGCTAAGQVVTCTLATGAAIGAHTFVYTATVATSATTSVSNSVAPSSGTCTSCTTTNPVNPTITVAKSANPGNGAPVAVGDTLTYTLTVNVANAATTAAEVLTDTLGAGLAVGTLPAGCTAAGQTITCTLAAGTAIGTHTFVYTATVSAAATTSVGNSVTASSGTCQSCSTSHPVNPTLTVSKSVAPGSGTPVAVGDTLTYTLTVNVANAATAAAEVLTDTLGTGLAIVALPAGCTAAGQIVTCTLPAGTAIGTHSFVYTATVGSDATTSVDNSVAPSSGTCTSCSTTNPVQSSIRVSKSVAPANGTAVSPGDTLSYTLTVEVANAVTTAPVTLTDTLGAGLTVATVPAGCTAAGQTLTCTLAAGTAIGTHAFAYTATVNADATTAVSNAVTTSTGTCAACTTTNPIAPRVAVSKSADPGTGATVKAGDLITYTVTVTVANSATTDAVALADTLAGGQTLLPASIQAPPGGNCTAVATGLECSLAAGAAPGTYAFVYQTQVDASASGTLGNRVAASGGGGQPPDCQACSTEHPVAEPVINVNKSADPAGGASLNIGDTIHYTLAVEVAQAATTSDLVLQDTPGAGLTLGAMPAGCTASGATLRCVLPSGSVPGRYAFTYPATINANAGSTVANVVAASGGGGGSTEPTCANCATEHRVVEAPQLRVVKRSSVREAKIGDLVRYTLTVQNVGTSNVIGADVIDTPPAGFSYVDGSLAVTDGDNAASVSGHNPIRFAGLDVAAGESATLMYLMRIGAGVRPGTLVNQAQAHSGTGRPISNIATAELTLAADPLTDDSLIMGTVFDDRDGDGWQDNAELTGVRVRGGFAAAAYVPGSTTLDRGAGAQPLADASAPLLHGIDLGGIGARQSAADPAQRRQLVLRQRLSRPEFTDDFVLSTGQGVTLRMDAAGATTLSRDGDAAKGLNGAVPEVERRVAQGEGGYVVDYLIRNAGIDERGIPGVRIASVDGLLVETDPFGRYHLAGIPGGAWERGRNFVLKVDPATLPPGTEITTDNPLVRRITPGLPVRFDFGAKLPVEAIAGAGRRFGLELGEVIFAPGSAELRERYLATIAQIAARVAEYGGGEVAIGADGESQALAFDRANAVKTALLAKLPTATAQATSVSVRTAVADPATLIAGVDGAGTRLGTVLFETDRDTVRPQFAPLLDRIAAHLQQAGGGTVSVIGRADVRGGDAHNLDLGLRRAKAVYEALAQRLSPQVRGRVRVETSDGPAAPAGGGQ